MQNPPPHTHSGTPHSDTTVGCPRLPQPGLPVSSFCHSFTPRSPVPPLVPEVVAVGLGAQRRHGARRRHVGKVGAHKRERHGQEAIGRRQAHLRATSAPGRARVRHLAKARLTQGLRRFAVLPLPGARLPVRPAPRLSAASAVAPSSLPFPLLPPPTHFPSLALPSPSASCPFLLRAGVRRSFAVLPLAASSRVTLWPGLVPLSLPPC